MEWYVSPEWRTPHAIKPWSESKSEFRAEPIHYGDCPEAITACLTYTRPSCGGDCFRRMEATGPSEAVKKRVDPKKVIELYRTGISLQSVAKELHISRSTVKYWLEKMGEMRKPPEKKKEITEDPCLKCRSAYLCRARGWTCSEKARYKAK